MSTLGGVGYNSSSHTIDEDLLIGLFLEFFLVINCVFEFSKIRRMQMNMLQFSIINRYVVAHLWR
jgi:hypothetical protein